jgi:hypothetical protein
MSTTAASLASFHAALSAATASELKLAVQCGVPDVRASDLRLDVVVGCDCTGSMRGDGEEGLRTVLTNLPSMCERELHELETDTADRARLTTSFHAFQFATEAKPFASFVDSQFVPLHEREALAEACKLAGRDVNHYGRKTNLEAAIDYACALATERKQAMRLADLAAGARRIFALVLFTDGVANDGSCDPHALAERATNAGVVVFGLGLGDKVNPGFLSDLSKLGFFAHAADPGAPRDAFALTVGRCLTATNASTLDIVVTVYDANGDPLPSSTKEKRVLGLVDPHNASPRAVPVLVPERVRVGDVVSARVVVGGDLLETVRVPIAAATESNHDHPLVVEVTESEKALQAIRRAILETKDSCALPTASELLVSVGDTPSARHHVARYAKSLKRSADSEVPTLVACGARSSKFSRSSFASQLSS